MIGVLSACAEGMWREVGTLVLFALLPAIVYGHWRGWW